HKLTVVYRCEHAFGTRHGRTDRRDRKDYQGGYSSNEHLDCKIVHNNPLLPCRGKLPSSQSTAQLPGMFLTLASYGDDSIPLLFRFDASAGSAAAGPGGSKVDPL